MASTRILVADDHPIVLRGLKTVLNAQPDCEVVAEATDGEEAVNLALTEDVHLAILDISMPRKTGLQAAREITHRKPEVRVLMLSMHDNEQYLFEAIKAGAQGYLHKNLEAAQLRAMLEAVSRGEAAITPATAARMIEEFLRRQRLAEQPDAGRRGAGPDHLTPRELEVLGLVTRGLRNKEIAASLGISENTVKFHLRNILDKLHAGSRAEVAARAVGEGLVAPPDDTSSS